jgi:hypothetical protein
MYKLQQLCLLSWNDSPRNEIPPNLYDQLPTSVLDALDAEFNRYSIGPDFMQEVECPLCEAFNTLELGASDFLFPQASVSKRRQ